MCSSLRLLLDVIASTEQGRHWTRQSSEQPQIVDSFRLGDHGKDGCDIVVLAGHLQSV
jgi:hypothetical protein